MQSKVDNDMEKKFCQAIIENDRAALKILFDRKLDTLKPEGNLDEIFDKIKIWMENYECISSVEIVSGVLRTEPPVKEFVYKVESNTNEVIIRNFGIKLFPGKLRFDHK